MESTEDFALELNIFIRHMNYKRLESLFYLFEQDCLAKILFND